MMRLLKTCWRRRWIRGFVWTLFTLLTLVVLFIMWVNWSGARQLRAVEAMLAREGQPLDFHAIAPEVIPDEENFCAIPPLKDLALVIDNDVNKGEPGKKRARVKEFCLPSWNDGARVTLADSALGKRPDVKQWAEALRKKGAPPVSGDVEEAAREILAEISKQDAFFRELAAGLDRPAAQWTPAWRTREFPADLISLPLAHLNSVIDLHRTLTVRAIAAAHIGDAAQAHESLQILARIDQACAGEPFLIGMLVAGSGAVMLTNSTWEICDMQVGTAEDFSRLEKALAVLDFRQSVTQAARAEIVFGVTELRYFASLSPRHRQAIFLNDTRSQHASEWDLPLRLACWLPAGFFEMNAAVIADREWRYFVKPIQNGGWPAALAATEDFDVELQRMRDEMKRHPSYIATALFAPAHGVAVGRGVYDQALVNMAVIACALERYRIQKGSYPDSLDDVRLADGQPLPRDVMTGGPIGYRRTPNGKYALWSVGRSGKDHGGLRVVNKKDPEKTKFWKDDYKGDWVWDFPEK